MSSRYPNNAIDRAIANYIRAYDQAFRPVSDPYAKVDLESEVSE